MNLLLFLVDNNLIATNTSSSSSFCYNNNNKKETESLSGDVEDLKCLGSGIPLFFKKKKYAQSLCCFSLFTDGLETGI